MIRAIKKYKMLTSVIALCCCNVSYATIMPTASAFCPVAPSLICKPVADSNTSNDGTSGKWQGHNADGKHFESHTNYPCTATILELLTAQTEVIDTYKIKCVYQATEETGVKYTIALFNEHSYQLCPDNSIVDVDKNCN